MKAVLLTLLIICLMAVMSILAYSITRRDPLRSLYYTVMCSGTALYLLGYILEVTSATQEAAVISLKVQNLGIPFIAPFFLLFMLDICNYRPLRGWIPYAVFVYAIGLFLVILFNEYHHLYYSSIKYVAVSDMHYLDLRRGPAFYINEMVIVGCCMAAYLGLARRSRLWSPEARQQMRFIVIGSAIPLLSNLLYASGLLPQHIDPTPVALTLCALCCMVSLVGHNLFDLKDIAAQSAIQSMDTAVIIVDAHWCCRLRNSVAEELFPGLERLPGTDPVTRAQGWPRALSAAAGEGKVSFERTEGERTRYYRARVCPISEKSVAVGWSIVIRDVTESTEMMERLNTLATTDSLTGLSNRRFFLDSVQREMEMAKREDIVSALILFDLDHFKKVNDVHGHQAGDVVLRAISETVRQELRPYDIFARYGGEEFTLFIINISPEDALGFAWRLCRKVGEVCIPHQGADIVVTASFGVVDVRGGDELEQVIAAADCAMYTAKQKGRNRVEAGVIEREGMKINRYVKG